MDVVIETSDRLPFFRTCAAKNVSTGRPPPVRGRSVSRTSERGVAAGAAWSLMILNLDVYRAAKLLIEQHGTDAGLNPAGRVDLLLEQGDVEGAARRHQALYGATTGR